MIHKNKRNVGLGAACLLLSLTVVGCAVTPSETTGGTLAPLQTTTASLMETTTTALPIASTTTGSTEADQSSTTKTAETTLGTTMEPGWAATTSTEASRETTTVGTTAASAATTTVEPATTTAATTTQPIQPTAPSSPTATTKATEETTTAAVTTAKPTEFLPMDAPRLEAEHVSASAGEKGVTVRVFLKNNPGLSCFGVTVTFDDDAMQMQSSKRNGEYARACQFNFVPGGVIDGNQCNFMWYRTSPTEASDEGGAVLILKFDIDADTAPGVYPITLSYFSGAPASTDGKTETPVGMISGSVTVS